MRSALPVGWPQASAGMAARAERVVMKACVANTRAPLVTVVALERGCGGSCACTKGGRGQRA